MVHSVYRRSPAIFRLADDTSAPERRFALMEAIHGVGGLLAALECRWMNHLSLQSIDCAVVEITAHTFQQWIGKEFDVRVTVAGDHRFGVDHPYRK
jgi:hypothetical protein